MVINLLLYTSYKQTYINVHMYAHTHTHSRKRVRSKSRGMMVNKTWSSQNVTQIPFGISNHGPVLSFENESIIFLFNLMPFF